MSRHRFAAGPAIFADLGRRAEGRETITYGEFARIHDLGAPIGLSWILMPLLLWCCERGLPPLPIIVVRSRDGLPSGPYRAEDVAIDTERVFVHRWKEVTPPAADELAAAAFRRRIERRAREG